MNSTGFHLKNTGIMAVVCMTVFLLSRTGSPAASAVIVLSVLQGADLSCRIRQDDEPFMQILLSGILRFGLCGLAVTMITAASFGPDDFWLYLQHEITAVLQCSYYTYLETGESTSSPLYWMYVSSLILRIWPAAVLLGQAAKMLKKKSEAAPAVLTGICAAAMAVYAYSVQDGTYSVWKYAFSILTGMCCGCIPPEPKNSRLKYLIAILQAGITAWLLYAQIPYTWLILPVCAGCLYLCGCPVYTESVIWNLLDLYGSCWYETVIVCLPLMFIFGPEYGLAAAIAGPVLRCIFSFDFRRTKIIAVQCLLAAMLCIPAYRGWTAYQAMEDPSIELQAIAEHIEANRSVLPLMQDAYMQEYEEDEKLRQDTDAMIETAGVPDLPVSGIGDSVMLGAAQALQEAFVHGDFDAAVSRAHFVLYNMIAERTADGTLKDNVLIGIGTNGILPLDLCRQIVEMCGNRQVYWITTTNNWQFYNTDTIQTLDQEYDNVTAVDWDGYSMEHGEYFAPDGIHLTWQGRQAYIRCIQETMAENIIDDQLEERQRQRIAVFGSEVLLSAADLLQTSLEHCTVYADQEQSLQKIVDEINALQEQHRMADRVLLVSGPEDTVTEEDLQKINTALEGRKAVWIIISPDASGPDPLLLEAENIRIIDHRYLYSFDPECFAADRRHLSEKGNRVISGFIEEAAEILRDWQ